jgi:hypothetical protein
MLLYIFVSTRSNYLYKALKNHFVYFAIFVGIFFDENHYEQELKVQRLYGKGNLYQLKRKLQVRHSIVKRESGNHYAL